MQIKLQIVHRVPIKITSQYFDFIGGTLNYVTYVMSKKVKLFFKKFTS